MVCEGGRGVENVQKTVYVVYEQPLSLPFQIWTKFLKQIAMLIIIKVILWHLSMFSKFEFDIPDLGSQNYKKDANKVKLLIDVRINCYNIEKTMI